MNFSVIFLGCRFISAATAVLRHRTCAKSLKIKTADMPSGSRRMQNSVNSQRTKIRRSTVQRNQTRWIMPPCMGNSCISPVHGAILAE